MANLYGSLCLSDIPKELITVGKNGKKYLNIEINERRTPSQFGATHYVKASVKREQRVEGANYYIGDLKPSNYSNSGQQNPGYSAQSAPQGGASFNQPDENGDLPF